MVGEHRVGIVLDGSFGPSLMLLAQRLHVWAVASSANNQAAEDFLKAEVPVAGDPLESGITIFEPQGDSQAEILASVLEDIDEHHGEYAHTPPWSVLEIYGLDENDAHAQLVEYGVTQVQRTKFGVQARRVI